jgi:hypothetical protein
MGKRGGEKGEVSIQTLVHEWKEKNKIRKTGLNRNMSQLLGDAQMKHREHYDRQSR